MLRSNQHDFGHTTFYLSFGVRPGRSFNSDANEYFHSNRNNPDLRKAVDPKFATDIPPTTPVINTRLVYKAVH